MSIFGEGSLSEWSRDVVALRVSIIPLHASPNNNTILWYYVDVYLSRPLKADKRDFKIQRRNDNENVT